ncbi:MAG: DUF1496 domain-containing protein [Shewanella sp.]
MRNTIGALITLCYSVALAAAPQPIRLPPTQPATPLPIVIGTNTVQRLCYYQDQAYSLGAVILIGEIYLSCQPAHEFETHGALQWLPFNQQLNPIPKSKLIHP